MPNEYASVDADTQLRFSLTKLIELGFAEDLNGSMDWTSMAVIPASREGECALRTRETGTIAGLVVVPWILDAIQAEVTFEAFTEDAHKMEPGQTLGILRGRVRDLLTAERLVLNIVSRLCGVATLTAKYAAELVGTGCRLYDTRKTTVGWRRLEKYAVRCGGGYNHRGGLYDGFLIKDNHLALSESNSPISGAEAIRRAREWLGKQVDGHEAPKVIELEIDSLEQLDDALGASPDIILLDNFCTGDLSTAVEQRNRQNPQVQLEASGGVTIDTIRSIALTGVERISCGAITHQATWLDLGLDWVGN
jgi:nicotinate-nucleotide pyrophosphorylase (carboxylating)